MQSIGAVAALVAGLAIPAAAATGAMPVAQQNALVEKYCAVCHNDANKTGGLSLENFDAAHPDPSVVAMMVSKLKDGAFGASGVPLPDRTTQDALLSALSAEAAGASEWTVNRTQDPEAPILTASILREILSTANAGEPNVYRLALTCRVDTREAEMQLAWAPGDVPGSGGTMSAAGDGKAPLSRAASTTSPDRSSFVIGSRSPG